MMRREWENIDILLLSEKESFICATENKVFSSEHSNKLAKYESTIREDFKNYKKLFVYLTIEGDRPEKDFNWMPYSHEEIKRSVDSILLDSEDNIGEDICRMLTHYVEMIERHFMIDNEIVDLSKKLYQRHKKAFDIIFEHKPGALTETNKYLVDYLKSQFVKDIEFEHCSKGYVRFAIKRWDDVVGQLSGNGQWTKSNRVILFEIQNTPVGITLKLILEPGNTEFREKLFYETVRGSKLFKERSKSLYDKWTKIYKRKIVTKQQMEYGLESVKNLIQQELSKFFDFGEFVELCSVVDVQLGINMKSD